MIAVAHPFLDPALVYVAALGLNTAILTAVTVRRAYAARPAAETEALHLGIVTLAAAALAALATGTVSAPAVMAVGTVLLCGLVRLVLPRLTMVGSLHMIAPPLLLVTGIPWTYHVLAINGMPATVMGLFAATSVVSAVGVALGLGELLARQALLTHGRWPRPFEAREPRTGPNAPKVSLHVPCYAEPPEIVIETLQHLADLDYDNYEVLVCDNNTQDEALWRPLQRFCERANVRHPGRFRFFHLDKLPGAKAGALNFCLTQMAPDAELVAVVDADYLARPDFLSRLVGFFDKPYLGYVQTPHDYREHEDSAYLNACYWEYMPSNKIELAGVAQYDAAYTIGTMCLIRREALEAAGGWAEWCLTEDSEVSVRLRALGYGGVYLRETFGRGLIPETFSDYKKQRFRWTAGPVQQLKRHWRLYLPEALGGSDAIGGWSKFLEVQRGIAPIQQLVAMVGGLVMLGVGVMLTAAGVLPQIDLPGVAWLTMAIGGIGFLVARWHRYRLSGCRSIAEMVRGEIARMSLTYVQLVAGVAGLSARPLAWNRTPKFKAEAQGVTARDLLRLPETRIGIAHVAAALILLLVSGRIGADLTLLGVIGLLASALHFFTAPLMLVLGERRLSRLDADEPPATLEEVRAAA